MAGYPGFYGNMGGMQGGFNPYMSSYNPYGGFNPYMGGYSGLGLFGGYSGFNPYMGASYGGGMFMPGFLDQFQAQLDDMFSRYFTNQNQPIATTETTPQPTQPNVQPTQTNTTTVPSTVSADPFRFGKNFGAGYLKTGKFGQQGLEQIKQADYGSQEEFLQNNPIGQRLEQQGSTVVKNTSGRRPNYK